MQTSNSPDESTPAVETTTPASSPAEGGGSPAVEGGPAAAPAPTPPEGGAGSGAPAPPSTDWRDRRIAQLTAQLKSEREKAVKGAAVPPPSPPPAAPDDSVVEARARELAAHQEFLRQCDELQQGGRQAFGQVDFDGRTNALRQLIDPNNPTEASAWNALLVAARETGEGPRLLYELGADLNTAQRLLGLPPVRMAVELTKMAQKAPEAPAEGDGPLAAPLPRPIRPVGARGGNHNPIAPDDPERSEQLDMATWMARRAAQVKERGLR